MAEAYQGLTGIVEASLQRQVEAIKARYQQEQAALEISKQSELARITQSTQLLTAALTEQATLRQQATADTLKLIDDESKARLEAARRQGQTDQERAANVQRVENAILATKRQAPDAGARRVPPAHRRPQRRGQPASGRGPAHRGAEAAALALDGGAHPRDPSPGHDRSRGHRGPQAPDRRVPGQGPRRPWPTGNSSRPASSPSRRWTWPPRWPAPRPAKRQARRGGPPRRPNRATRRSPSSRRRRARPTAARNTTRPRALKRQADALRAELAQKAREADAQIAQGKDGVTQAIGRIRDSQDPAQPGPGRRGQGPPAGRPVRP